MVFILLLGLSKEMFLFTSAEQLERKPSEYWHGYWIGLNDRKTEGTFVNTDNTQVSGGASG